MRKTAAFFLHRKKCVAMDTSGSNWKMKIVLAVLGGLVFWISNFFISLTPIAAYYRELVSITYLPMLLAALIAGLCIGFCVSHFLIKFYDRIPTTNPISKSLLLTFLALILITLFIEMPSRFISPTDTSWQTFMIGLSFNLIRFLALAFTIGYAWMKIQRQNTKRLVVHVQ